MRVTGLKIVVGEIEFIVETSTGDLIEVDWIGGVKQRLVAGTDKFNDVVTQVVELLRTQDTAMRAGKMTDTDVKL